MTLAAAAEAYVRRLGFSLVVQNPDKSPSRFFPHGASSATRHLDHIQRALAGTPGALIAARVGRYMVLDVDVRHGGPDALDRLLNTYGDLPDTWRQVTPSGGLHIWFTHPGFRCKGTITKGVEVITGNRCITLSPSARSGVNYQWVRHPLKVPLAEPPEWLVTMVRPPEPPRITEPVDVPVEQRLRRAQAYLERADSAVSGNNGHSQTFWLAQVVARGFMLDAGDALQAMQDWNGRCDPPWSENDLKRKIREALQRGSMPFGKMLEQRENR